MPRIKLTKRNLLKVGEECHLFEYGKMLLSETVAAEKASGLTWPQIVAGVQTGVSSAIQPVLWLLRKRSNPRLKITEVDFSMEEYELVDPDFEPDYWVVVDDDYGVVGLDVLDVDDDGNVVKEPERPQDTVPEDPKAEPSTPEDQAD